MKTPVRFRNEINAPVKNKLGARFSKKQDNIKTFVIYFGACGNVNNVV